MSFLETPRFPEDISWGSRGGPQYNTTVVEMYSGHEQRRQNWTHPRHVYDVIYGINTKAKLDALIEFFHAVGGKLDGFRYKDFHDYKSTLSTGTVNWNDQNIAIGDGVTQDFQITKTYTKGALSRVRDIKKLVSGSVRSGLDGVEKTITTDWTINLNTGILHYNTAPGNNVVVKAGYEFDVPVRFDSDLLSVDLESLVATKTSILLKEIRV